MSFSRGAVRESVTTMVGQFPMFTGSNELDEATILKAVDQAVSRFSRDNPHEHYEQVTGDAGKYYPLTGGSKAVQSWDEEFSIVLSIDYDDEDRITNDEFPNMLDESAGDWKTVKRNDGIVYLFLPNHAPGTDVKFTVHYMGLHTLGDDVADTTIKATHQLAIEYLSVAKFLTIAGIHTEKATDGPFGTEYVSMRTKSSGFLNMAKKYEEMYLDEMGGEDGEVPFDYQFDTDLTYLDGTPYLFHDKRIT